MTFYSFAKVVVWRIFKPLFRIQVIGLENFPKSGGVLLCPNHIDNLDPPVVGITAPRPVIFMGKEELFKTPVIKTLMKHLNVFPVKRGMNDREALRKGLKVLKDNQVLGLFPEGKRSKTGELGEGLSGAGFFALRSEAAVVPCAIIGPYKPFKKLKVVYGQPIDMKELREKKASASEVTAVIMDHLKKLIETHRC
ncbi:lysophospholipid acyltransferase family protein [Heyndrickxia sporothermodurans]|uniref:1-acyl-sn-glycerol-3-phosphate acyltransferase n=1 Tax=Heyndrickxia sporothermodurans TaxID=46224 RepID=A0AB37H6G7_9BACI|nr:lysophospholipid acyltransferase family protein [Heyndrickxia sporothermodurans]MBL5767322.1 1-acyl-sn-glycerol-3-phosphate acyltransferase [Heyndrickxia sporothermodurans]MBL5770249.1 1-acyl-sn-glycerol-3-phosphate acyltransferase [Heyndrickxia sporothermodurans]MBL5774099.1 1-acyl-sn-glycerol-3-phosphate acyltransferase [Heyndrickxia sporothermodurans]MBL5777438.1 1-acyl-sn-glycerol-3-phosphate acyltransferase [Heyndrickxia sporothermodurans]MBL5782699.1 1-acyl-sn-glycerol-3-phosphate acy